MIRTKLKQLWANLQLRYKVALFIGILSVILSSLFFIKPNLSSSAIVYSFAGVILIIHLIYCGGFELSRGILPKSLCNDYIKIILILLTIFVLTFIIGIIMGYLIELIVKLVPYLKNKKIRRNFLFLLVSLLVIFVILGIILSQNP